LVTEYISDNIEQVVSAIESVSTFALDLETTGLEPIDSRILLCQIGVPGINYVINAAQVPLEPLLPYLTERRWKKIIQNSKFERRFFFNKYSVAINNVFDTQLAEQLLRPDGYGFSLENLADKYLLRKMNKAVRKSFYERKKFVLTTEQIEYAAEDVDVLLPIMEAQYKQLEKHGMLQLAELEFELAQVVASMEEEGTPIDQVKWRALIKGVEIRHEEARLDMLNILYGSGKLDEQMGLFERGGINVASPKQIKDAFKVIGIDVDSTNEREIALIDHPAAAALLTFRGLDKTLNSYGGSFLDKIHPFTGRIHADFKQLGTETGRFSCREPNLQQMPEEFRECVLLEDWVIVGADYSQIELRILAELSGDQNFIRAFNSGEDLHKSTAALMFGIPLASVTKEQRFMAKSINFGIAYGMGPGKLMDTINSEAHKTGGKTHTFPEVVSMFERYKATYKQVNNWLQQAANKAVMTMESETMYGRKRFYNRPDPNTLDSKEYDRQIGAIKRRGANSPIQGTNADITKLAMLNVYNNLEEGGYRAKIIIQVHDEIVVLAHKRQAEQVKQVVLDSMVESAEKFLKKVPVKADAYINPFWKK
jgi:DNA polymerase I-like protein with 3'-5' exonuclease and polymerase domains